VKPVVTPFLASLPSATRALGELLPNVATTPAYSPWSPQPPAPAPAAVDTAAATAALAAARAEVDRMRATAVADGRRDGLAETEALRAQLSSMLHALAEERKLQAAAHAELVADATLTVIEAWLDHSVGDAGARFAPLVRGWLERTGDGADTTATAHPDDLDALRAAIGDAAITLQPDPTMARGDLRLRGRGLDLEHRWVDRLRELRHELATVFEPAVIAAAAAAAEVATASAEPTP
jgi:flagellar biosynthesis/type III secretory pathway protein FliH